MVQWNKTPLMYAAQYAKSLEVVELLLKGNADVNAKEIVSARERDG